MTFSGLPADHLCRALLWHIWAEGKNHLLWQELQLAYLHVLHSLHSGRPRSRRPARAVQTQNHPDNVSRLPLHQDTDQCYPQGGGGCLYWRDQILNKCRHYDVYLLLHLWLSRLFLSPSRWRLKICRRRLRSSLSPQTKTPQTLKCFRWCSRAVWAPLSTRW